MSGTIVLIMLLGWLACTAFMTILEAGQPGSLVETGPTSSIFDAPTNEVTGDYVSGRFG